MSVRPATGGASDLFGEPRRYTESEVAAAAGVSVARARRYWRALGYPSVPAQARELTASDVEVLRVITGYVDDGALAEPDSLRVARLLGQSIAQLARLQLEILVDQAGHDGLADATADLMGRVPEMEWLLGRIWQRQLLAALPALQPRPNDPATTSAVGFADIVGFTELSTNRTDAELTRIVSRFEYQITTIVTEGGGTVVKLLGDEVLFTADRAVSVAGIATRLLDAFADDPDIQALRIGVAYGPVIHYLGDVFGTTVNLASRLTGLTEPGTILAAPEFAEQLSGVPGFGLKHAGTHDVRGIGPVDPVLVRRL
ncbi:adenylate/guanylate cyclase domain-containing protein [Nocardia sp. XZ_19_231]|uniref:adenylate/guanylate cyclase domain-containing protein n=1 Tax=Nocardia sp. XZ_19_231 TaxID=2769252 RepID=UPI00188F729D|nr:adenylate/guanylate cyclase domain-containing protein [Nocardia sp. XZ_19_231]